MLNVNDWPEVDLPYPEPQPPVRIMQQPWEITQLVELYQELRPRNILEIGSDSGGTLWYWIQFAPEGASIVACDLLLPHAETSAYGHSIWPEWAMKAEVKLTIANMLSSDIAKLDQIVCQSCPDGLDFCFIDAAHDYENARRDFEFCLGHLSQNGGVICLHDIAFPRIPRANEVDVLWSEIKQKYPNTKEFIGTPANGIGVVYVSERAQ